MSRLRNQADYADEVPGLNGEALSAVVTAEQIVELLPRLELAD
jgi:hypothetical protein